MLRRRRLLRALLGAVLALPVAIGAACHRNEEAPVPEAGSIMLYVDNRGWDDMNVMIGRGQLVDRLGRVSAAGKFQVALDRYVINQAGDIRLVAQPVGTRYYGLGASAVSPILNLLPGQVVIWTIEKDLTRSFIEVR
jgi:hypothetical protein